MTRRSIKYSTAEMLWLETNRMMVISDYHRVFLAAFGRRGVSAAHLHGLRKRKGWKVGRDPGRYVGRNTKYTSAELAWLRDNRTMIVGDYHRAFCAQFGKSDVTPGALNGLRKKHGWKTGRSGHFEKGAAPANKGKKMPFNPNSARTQFKAGQLPHNTKYVGHEHVRTDGYVEISIEQTNPYTGYQRRYVLKHRWLWEQMNGPIPDDMVLKCKGDCLNVDPSNWELVPRALLPRLNGRFGRGYDEAPAELKPVIMTVVKLEHSVREKSRARGAA
jgi:HNH endonuclease